MKVEIEFDANDESQAGVPYHRVRLMPENDKELDLLKIMYVTPVVVTCDDWEQEAAMEIADKI